MNYLLQQFEGDTNKLWQSNIFGRSFNEIVGDDLQAKLKRMPEPAQKKMQEALERIINEGGGGPDLYNTVKASNFTAYKTDA